MVFHGKQIDRKGESWIRGITTWYIVDIVRDDCHLHFIHIMRYVRTLRDDVTKGMIISSLAAKYFHPGGPF